MAHRALADVPEDDLWLTEGERLTLNRLRFPKRRAEWRLGRWTTKRLILDYLRKSTKILPSEIEIRAAEDGAPELFFDRYPAKRTISISHRDGLGFSVISPAGISTGCDLAPDPNNPDLQRFAANKVGNYYCNLGYEALEKNRDC